METKTIQIRIRWKTWKALRRIFPANREESAADYIERVKKFLEARKYRTYRK